MLMSLCPMIICKTLISRPASAHLVQNVCLSICGFICGSRTGSLCSLSAFITSFLLYALTSPSSALPKLRELIGVPLRVINIRPFSPSTFCSFALLPSTRSISFCFIRAFLTFSVNGIRHLVSIFELNDLDYKITANSIDFTLDIEEQFRIREQQNSIINQQINSTDVEIIHGYSFESIREALTCEFLKMLELNIKIKKCAICDKYFIVNGHDGECCDNLYKDTGLTCQQVYADRNYKNKRKKNPILKEYDKCYKRMYARYSSRKNLSSEKYNSWKEEAARERDKALAAYAANPSDTIIEDFKKFLGNK